MLHPGDSGVKPVTFTGGQFTFGLGPELVLLPRPPWPSGGAVSLFPECF